MSFGNFTKISFLQTSIEDDEDSDEDDDDEFDYEDETSLESFVTPLDDEDTAPDEYQIFRSVVQEIQSKNPNWYGKLTGGLTQEHGKKVMEVFKLCEQRQEAKRSKSIEQAGGMYYFEFLKSLKTCNIFIISGYQFNQQAVPGQFNFAPNSPNFQFGGPN